MRLTENARIILDKRYLLKDSQGKASETPEEMFMRVATHVADAEKLYGNNAAYWTERFYKLMSDLRFLPNSPAMMNAGKPIGQLAACFVLPVDDSMDSIFNTLRNAALILQSGGGTGFSFSRLRPRSDIVRTTGGKASGPVSFMQVFNMATEVIRQGGARRGANMGILRVDHPDIMEFIRSKRKIGELANFNISVAITDSFMKALHDDSSYHLINPRTKERSGTLMAQDVFREIAESAWETGDPGIVFIDVINRSNPTPHLGTFESTNPCGEQPLLPYEACILGSLNLTRYLLHNAAAPTLDYARLSDDIMTCVRFLDNAIDVNRYPLPDIEAMHQGNRKIGLGVMGWADLLIALGIPYDSKKALNTADEIMKFIRNRARDCSAHLARERGPFPNYQGSLYDRLKMPPLRNATTTTIAPTGTLSIIADCSSGIEPLFALAYKRRLLGMELSEVNSSFFACAERRGFANISLRETVLRKGNLQGLKQVPADVRRLYKTAHEIHYRQHIRMQAAFQRHTDNAVSKTINMGVRSTREDIEKAFLMAYNEGCKGITVFRHGTKKKGALVNLYDTD